MAKLIYAAITSLDLFAGGMRFLEGAQPAFPR